MVKLFRHFILMSLYKDNVNQCDIKKTKPMNKKCNYLRSLMSVKALAVPLYTRELVVYVLRPWKKGNEEEEEESECLHALTRDAMFSGGRGVPFEVNLDKGQETLMKVEKRKPRDPV